MNMTPKIFLAIVVSFHASILLASGERKESIDEITAELEHGASIWSKGTQIGTLPPKLTEIATIKFDKKEYKYRIEVVTGRCDHAFYEVFLAEYKCSLKSSECYWAFNETGECIAYSH